MSKRAQRRDKRITHNLPDVSGSAELEAGIKALAAEAWRTHPNNKGQDEALANLLTAAKAMLNNPKWTDRERLRAAIAKAEGR